MTSHHNTKLFDLAAQIKGETDKAIRLFDGTKTEWVPKSQVEDNGDGTFTMPHSRWRHPHIIRPKPGLPLTDGRRPTDGEPYYCMFCGSGWNEYGACEDVRCTLEAKEQAMKRLIGAPSPPGGGGERRSGNAEP